MNINKQLTNNYSKNSPLESLYPDLPPEEREEAIYNLRRYLNLVWRIYQRLKRENPQLLTEELLNARFKQPHR